MQIRLGTKAYGSDDQQVGIVSYVVLFPGTKEITHLVIQKDSQSTDQTFVPVGQIYSADEKRVVLRQSAQDFAQARPYEPGGSVPVESRGQSAEFAPAMRNMPEGTVALHDGAKAISSDGVDVGGVERVFTNEDKITQLLVTKGKLRKSRKMVPVDLVSSIKENEVRLTADADYVDNLPEQQPEAQQVS